MQQITLELLQQQPEYILLVPSSQSNEQNCIQPAAKAIKIEGEEAITNTCAADDIILLWITYNRNILKHSDKKIIEDGSQLTDKHIRLAQTLIKGQFPKIGVAINITARKVKVHHQIQFK